MSDSYMDGHIYYSPRARNVAQTDYGDVSQAVRSALRTNPKEYLRSFVIISFVSFCTN